MTDGQTGGAMRDGSAGARLRAARLVLAAAALLAIVAVVGFGLHPAAALAGLAVLALAAALPMGNADPVAGVAPAPAPRAASSLWPDTGMRLALDAIADPCILVDGAGVVRFQNRAAGARFGAFRPGDPVAFKLRVPEVLAALDQVGRGDAVEPIHYAERVQTERFTIAHVTAIHLPGRGEQRRRPDFVLVRLVDETERVRVERMRGDFIANASHELRTPLASLTGFIETLLGPARDDAANRERFLGIMLEQARRMARLIDDLLSLSRIELREHVQPEAEVDLAALAEHVIASLGPLARENGATIASQLPDRPAPVRGDRDELIQVISNLVENAVKYGRQGGRVVVVVAPEADVAGPPGWLLSVTDDGPGIAPEHLPRLTERFYRVEADGSRRQKGTGLGLAIVKHIVNRHRGRLAIRSRLGEGSTFSVWLERPETPSEEKS